MIVKNSKIDEKIQLGNVRSGSLCFLCNQIVAYGNQALEGATIENVGSIIIYGDNATDGTLIKTGDSYSEVDLMIIGNHNSNLRFICNNGHNCMITCSSQCSIELRCHGNCTTSGDIEILGMIYVIHVRLYPI